MAERKINGREFKVGSVLATEAIKLQVRLMKLIGASVERLPVILAGVEGSSEEAKAKSRAAAVAAFTDIFAESDADEITQLISDVVSLATIKRPSGVYEQVDVNGEFTEDKGSLFPVVIFVLQEVLGDFFTGLRVNGLSGITKSTG